MNLKVDIRCVQTPKGSSCKYAYGAHRLNAVVAGVILEHTGRLFTWKSGNWSRRAERIVNNFKSRWGGVELTASEALEIAESRGVIPNIRKLRKLVDMEKMERIQEVYSKEW